MIKFSVRLAAALAVVVIFSTVSLAQNLVEENLPDTARIAFVNSDRTAIMAKRIGAPNVDTLIKSADKIKLSNLAVLASTKDGKSLMVSGTVSFPNPAFPNLTITADILAKVDEPFTMNDKITYAPDKVTVKAIGSFNLLQIYNNQGMIKYPLGTISKDGKEWYVTWTKVLIGGLPLWFYHGKFDGSDMKIDSFQFTAGSDYMHMTNIVTTRDNASMYVVIADRISTDLTRFFGQQWTPRPGIGQSGLYDAAQFDAVARNKTPGIVNMDSAFAFILRANTDENPDDRMEVGLIQKNRTLNNFFFPVTGSLSLTLDNSRTIAPSAIPDSLRLFVGYTGNATNQNDGKEVYTSTAKPGGLGNGGDMAYDFDGKSVVFVTCGITPDGEYTADNVHSQIWTYHFGDGQAKLVHSDENVMERQPIFMGTSPRPAPYVPGTATIDQNTLTFPSTKINKTSPMSFSINVPTSSKVIVSALTMGGTDPGAFSIVPAIATPFDVTGHTSKLVTVQFAPTTVQSYSATLDIVYHDSLNQEGNKTLTVSLSGIGETDQAVRPEAEQYFSMNIVPNPLKTSSSVEVTAKENGSVSLEIVNEAGASLYKSASKYIGAGEKTTFVFDASTIGLSDGTYYALLHTAQGDIMRRVIVLK